MSSQTDDKGSGWFRVGSLACWTLTPYADRKWFTVAHELLTLIYFNAKELERPRILVADSEQTSKTNVLKSTEFSIKYSADNREEATRAYESIRREALKLKSDEWLEIEHETIGESPTLLIRALKFIGEDSKSPTQAPQQKHHTKKTKVTQTEKKQTVGTKVVGASQQEKERSLKELEASVATLKKQYLEAYQQLRDKVLNYLESKLFNDELRKRIRGISEQEKQRLEAQGAMTEREARRVLVEDLISAALTVIKSIGCSKTQKSHRQELMTKIEIGMLDILLKEGRETWNTQLSKLFEFTTQEKGTQQGAVTMTMDEVTREITRLRSKLTSGKGDVKDVRAHSKQHYYSFLDILKKVKTSSSEAKSKWVGKDLETMIRQSSKISKGEKQLIELARMLGSSHQKDLMELIEKTGV